MEDKWISVRVSVPIALEPFSKWRSFSKLMLVWDGGVADVAYYCEPADKRKQPFWEGLSGERIFVTHWQPVFPPIEQ